MISRYKSYGKGWHFDSYKHSLAAKGIKTKNSFVVKKIIDRFSSEASTPVFGNKVTDEQLRAKKMSSAKEKALIIAGSRGSMPKSMEEQIAYRELELSLQPRERKGIRTSRLITEKISPPHPFEDWDHYEERTKSKISQSAPLISRVDVRLVKQVVDKKSGKVRLITTDEPTMEEYIDYLFDRRYLPNERYGAYDPSTDSFTGGYERAPPEAKGLEIYGGRPLTKKQTEKLLEGLEPAEKKIKGDEVKSVKPIEFAVEIKPVDAGAKDIKYSSKKIDMIQKTKGKK